MDIKAELTGIRQSMRILDGNGLHLGNVRDVSGHSILVQQVNGRQVFWLSASEVGTVGRNEVRLRSARKVIERAAETTGAWTLTSASRLLRPSAANT